MSRLSIAVSLGKKAVSKKAVSKSVREAVHSGKTSLWTGTVAATADLSPVEQVEVVQKSAASHPKSVSCEKDARQNCSVQPPPKSDPPADRDSILRSLRARVEATTLSRRGELACFSTGCPTIDGWLPEGGLHPCALTDWIAAHNSAAAASLSMLAAANRLRQIPDRPLVVIDCDGTFFPPAAVALGVPAERMILIRPRGGQDALWAIDHALRSTAVAGVWASLAQSG